MVGAGRRGGADCRGNRYRFATPKRPEVQMRIVVLPFQNLTGDPRQEFFADGMTEEMISQLGAMDRSGSASLPARRR